MLRRENRMKCDFDSSEIKWVRVISELLLLIYCCYSCIVYTVICLQIGQSGNFEMYSKIKSQHMNRFKIALIPCALVYISLHFSFFFLNWSICQYFFLLLSFKLFLAVFNCARFFDRKVCGVCCWILFLLFLFRL